PYHATPSPFPYTTLFRSVADIPPGCNCSGHAKRPQSPPAQRRTLPCCPSHHDRHCGNSGQKEGLGEKTEAQDDPSPKKRAPFSVDRKSTRLNSSHLVISY